jgi:uncharacterized iron-regulated membrane protein
MTNPGLDNRLRQHSRRAGFIIGISMALTIAVCIAGFAIIYQKVDPFTRDFVNAATITPTVKAKATSKTSNANNAAANTVANSTSAAQATNTSAPAQPAPTQTPAGFVADYRVSSDVRVNLRAGPSVDTDVVTTLDSGTELQYLNKAQDSTNPSADGAPRWLQFRTAGGDEGWVREIDVAKIG